MRRLVMVAAGAAVAMCGMVEPAGAAAPPVRLRLVVPLLVPQPPAPLGGVTQQLAAVNQLGSIGNVTASLGESNQLSPIAASAGLGFGATEDYLLAGSVGLRLNLLGGPTDPPPSD